MRFASHNVAAHATAVPPLLGVALVPAVIAIVLFCSSAYRAEETVRLPAYWARPAAAPESPVVSVRISRAGELTVAGQSVSDADRVADWLREAAAVRLLGFRPAQATVAVHADPDAPTALVQQRIAEARQAGFERFVLN